MSAPLAVSGRLARWQTKLLDVSLGNPLLSLKARVGLSVWWPQPCAVAQRLVDGGAPWTIAAAPISAMGGVWAALGLAGPEGGVGEIKTEHADERKTERERGKPAALVFGPTSDTHVSAGRKRLKRSEASAEEQQALERWAPEGQLVLDHDAQAVSDALARLESKNRLREDESGVHTLFLAVGMVQWSEGGEATHTAPLFLIPVTLDRPNVRTAFRLSGRDEDVVLNPALAHVLEKQREVDWTAVQAALLAERADMQKLMALARLALEGVGMVTDDAKLVLLSYAKHRMWQDIQERAEHISGHPVVQRLTGSATVDMPVTPALEWGELDTAWPPDRLFLPLPADASQVRAIARVDQGEHLVIEGPPGTGKSQTIANMIAHLLATGKRVLFVAEKLTALGVVHDRLKQIGLGSFCLELHTRSNNKTHILAQLSESLALKHQADSRTFHATADKVHMARRALNGSLDALHHVYPNGLSLYEAIGRLAGDPGRSVCHGLLFTDPLGENEDVVTARKAAVVRYGQVLQELPAAATVFNPLKNIDLGERGIWWKHVQQADQAVVSCERAWRNWSVAGQWMPDLKSITVRAWTNHTLLAEVWDSGADIPWTWRQAAWRGQLNGLAAAFKAADQEYVAAWTPFQPQLLSSVLHAPKELWDQWLAIQQMWGPKRWLEKLAWRRRADAWGRQGPLEDTAWTLWCGQAAEVVAAHQRVETAAHRMRTQTPQDAIWGRDGATLGVLLQRLERVEAWRIQMEEALHPCQGARSWVENSLAGGEDPLAQRPGGGRPTRSNDPWTQLEEHMVHFHDAINSMQDMALGWDHRDVAFGVVKDVIRSWISGQPAFAAWDAVLRHRLLAEEMGLGPILDALDEKLLKADDAGRVLDATYYRAFVHAGRMSNPEWIMYQGASRERMIDDFGALIDQCDAQTKAHVVSLMTEKMRQSPTERWADTAVLKREIAKRARHLATRQLIQKIPQLLPVLKPCLMMSPLSVAEYLSAEVPLFDVVIFDEASQIPTAEAIGVVARGRQVVVVGDPKQMPPSRMFAGTDDDDSEDGLVVDLESILDECLAGSMPSVLLNWHYRSRHEQLIAFSNQRYYKGELITFPSPMAQPNSFGLGLKVHDVNGVYDRGGTQTNLEEAQRVVEAMAEHLLSNQPLLSMGVVTFNSKQQDLIERLWNRELESRPELETRLSDLPQPLSIKNLESVQGDERDVIFFSTTFGRDAQGRFLMTFGPLGQAGGERRLNVAVTRARNRIEVFTSIAPHDIDVQRVTHQGVRDLHDWLLFARQAGVGVNTQVSPSLSAVDSPFEMAVVQALGAMGWSVETQVGCSGYRIDMAVMDPDQPGRYLAGLECDGATYHSFKIARDRDCQRQRRLLELGWSVVRVWSTDWFQDPEAELQRVDACLRALRERAQKPGSVENLPRIAPTAPTVLDGLENTTETTVVSAAGSSAPGCRQMIPVGHSAGLPDSPFELAVMEALEDLGWTIHPQIPHSGFLVDLAIVHPKHPDRYVAGLECDGATYHSSSSARANDEERQGVLEEQGWAIERVWSTDWFANPKAVRDQLHAALKRLSEQPTV